MPRRSEPCDTSGLALSDARVRGCRPGRLDIPELQGGALSFCHTDVGGFGRHYACCLSRRSGRSESNLTSAISGNTRFLVGGSFWAAKAESFRSFVLHVYVIIAMALVERRVGVAPPLNSVFPFLLAKGNLALNSVLRG